MRKSLLVSVFAAAAFAAPQALAQTGSETKQPYCLQQAGTGATNCTYVSMEACQKDMRAQGGNCIPNPAMTTGTGSGTTRPDMQDKK